MRRDINYMYYLPAIDSDVERIPLEKRVDYYRTHTIHGYFVDLVPVSETFTHDIVNLRNVDRSVYFLNQQYMLTDEMQNAWLKEYYKRDNDIYWCILDKNGEFLGTYRVYDINFEANTAEIGSTILREERAKERPYMLESTIIVYQLVFNKLNIKKILAHIRQDNEKVRAFDKHLGCHETTMSEINGVPYIETELIQSDFKYEQLNNILSHWKKRTK